MASFCLDVHDRPWLYRCFIDIPDRELAGIVEAKQYYDIRHSGNSHSDNRGGSRWFRVAPPLAPQQEIE